MKNLSIVCLILMFAVSCTTKEPTREEVAQSLIKNNLKEKLGDPKSYKPISFGTLDSVYTTHYDSDAIRKSYTIWTKYKAIYEKWDNKAETDRLLHNYDLAIYDAETAARFHDSAEVYRKLFLELYNSFTPEFKCWEMSHEYEAAGPQGIKVSLGGDFYIDKDLSRIDSTKIVLK